MKERLPAALVFCWVLCVLGAAGLTIWYVLWGGSAAERPERAHVSEALLAALAIVPPVLVWAWRRLRRVAKTSTPADVTDAADLLATRTLATWSEQLILRGIETPAPVRVRWRWAGEDVTLARRDLDASPALATDPGMLPVAVGEPSKTGQLLDSGVITRLHDEMYARLQHGRLLITGGPGAGKTGAMIMLLVEALKYRKQVPDAASARVPVPVWLTLGSWDPSSQKLRAWVTETIGRDHPYLRAQDFGPDAVRQLFDGGRIALFLDGLDEMPENLRGHALERLTSEAVGLRVLLSSRPEEFQRTIALAPQLPFTAVVELQSVEPQAAAEYLLEGQVGATREAWLDVAETMLARPDGVLAQTLSTPLTLSLARSAYVSDDPRHLLIRALADDEKALRGHLLDQVLSTAYTEPDERKRANYWLGWLAHNMKSQLNGTVRDLCWWEIMDWVPNWPLRLVVGITGGLAAGLLCGLAGAVIGGPVIGLIVALTVCLLVALIVGLMLEETVHGEDPWPIGLEWPWLHDLLPIATHVLGAMGFFALAGTLLGAAVWWDDAGFGLMFRDVGLVTALLSGLMAGLVAGLAAGIFLTELLFFETPRQPGISTSDVTPRLIYRMDMRSHILVWLVRGLTVVVVGGLLYGLLPALPIGFERELQRMLLGLLMIGFFVLLIPIRLSADLRLGAASSLLVTEIMLFLHGRPVRFMPLLETALKKQVLRQAGAVYQFRHAELQDRLAEQHEAGLTQHRSL
jgi:hypothetical protein